MRLDSPSAVLWLIFAAGVLLLAYPPLRVWGIAWFGLVPLLATTNVEGWRARLGRGYLFGVSFFGLGLAWLPDSIAQFGNIPFWSALISSIVIVAFLGLYPAFFALTLGYARNRAVRFFLFAPAFWVLLSTMRSNAWGGLPWLDLALTQLNGPLAGWYPLVGSPGVQAILVGINGGMALLITKRLSSQRNLKQASYGLWGTSAVAVLAIVVAVGSKTIQWSESVAPSWNIAGAVAGRPDAHALREPEQQTMQRTYRELAQVALRKEDLIVLPESAIQKDSGSFTKTIQKDLESHQAVVFGTIEQTMGPNFYNSIFLVTKTNTRLYRKQRPVAAGEMRPGWAQNLILKRLGLGEKSVLPGETEGPISWGETSLAMLICWETRFPQLTADQVRSGARMLINPANESWLSWSWPRYRSVAAAQVRAAETQRPVIRVTNAGRSALIGPQGNIRKDWITTEPNLWTASISGRQGLTPFTALQLDRWIPILFTALAFIILLNNFLSRIKGR